jgi:hypothetical protein
LFAIKDAEGPVYCGAEVFMTVEGKGVGDDKIMESLHLLDVIDSETSRLDYFSTSAKV